MRINRRKLRTVFRRLRFVAWFVAVVFLLSLAWFNLVGLPNFLKDRLVATLQERGVQLEFSRLRLRVLRGLVAENIRVGDAKIAGTPTLTAGEVQLQLDYSALLHRKLHLNGLLMRDGKLTLPASPTNNLVVYSVEARLQFEEEDRWRLEHFSADFAGAKISLAGEVSHAREMKNWDLFAVKKPRLPGAKSPLQSLADTLAKIKFEHQPLINATISGDARDLHSFVVRFNAEAFAVRTPWFSVRNLQAAASLTVPSNAPAGMDAAQGFWTNLQPYRLVWIARGATLRTKKLNADAVEIGGQWSAPVLAVNRFSAQLGGGKLNLTAKLDTGTRVLDFTNDSSFDLHAIAGILTPKTRARLDEISWTRPPLVRATGSLTLPPWTNGAVDFREDIEPTIRLAGGLEFLKADAAGAKLDSVRTHFSYADMRWKLPDLELVHAQTKLKINGEEDETTKNFHCLIRGALDAESFRPFLTSSNAIRGFGRFNCPQPLELDLDVRGNLRDFALLTATGRVSLADFSIRTQTVESISATLAYTNLMAEFFHPHVSRAGGSQFFSAEKLTLDIMGQKLFIQNGEGSLDPLVVARAIGPKTGRSMEPYQFLKIPGARVNGCVPLKHQNTDLVTDDADLYFEITGPVPFRWRSFETAGIRGTVHWWKNFLIVTNALAECYGGDAQGWGKFDVQTPGDGTEFGFFIHGTNVDLHEMGIALWSPSNQLAGALSGEVTVSSANSGDWRSWNGFGAGTLRDGLLWDVPVIGLLSPVLNAFSPGLGNSQATEAAGEFILTNGLIVTDSLEIRSLLMRLEYSGTVDLRKNVEARVTAQLLRNTPLFGPLISAVLWPVSKIFEFRVYGTLGDPKLEPLHGLPKLLLVPLHPIRSMEGLFTAPNTNMPPPVESLHRN